MYRILVAEDDEALRELILEILAEEGYEVQGAENGKDALDKLAASEFHMLVSDINMPVMGGFELFERTSHLYPELQRILITSYNVDEYMDLISTHNIGNIIVKGVPFDTTDLILLVQQLSTRDIFGLQKHLAVGTPIENVIIQSPGQIETLSHSLATLYGTEATVRKLRTVLIELLTNAMFYGARNEKGDDKSTWDTNFVLPPEQAITVQYGSDGEKIGFGVVDHGGRLSKKTILYWLNRQVTPENGGLPLGIYDSHGRGLYITRKYVDRLLIHVDPGRRCECLILNYIDRPRNAHKPLRIIEL